MGRRGFTRHYCLLVLREFTKEKILNVQRNPIFIPYRFHFDTNCTFILESRCEAHERRLFAFDEQMSQNLLQLVVPTATSKVSS